MGGQLIARMGHSGRPIKDLLQGEGSGNLACGVRKISQGGERRWQPVAAGGGEDAGEY